MTRLVTCGYETGDVNEAGTSTIGGGGALSVVSSTPTPRGGTYCLKAAVTITSSNAAYKTFTLAASKTDLWVRWAVYINNAANTIVVFLAGTLDSAGAQQLCVIWDPSSGALTIRQGFGTGGTLIGSGGVMSASAWHVLELRHQITSTSSGTTELWLDGTQVINVTNDNTGVSGLANVQRVALGSLAISSVNSTSFYLAVDDIAINDTAGTVNNGRPGDGRIVLLSPTGAGSNTGLTRGGTDSGANWSQTEELPPSMTDYVYGATAALRDTYALSDLPVTPSSITAVEVIALAQNSDAGAGSLGLTVKSGGTTNEGTAQALGTTAAYIRQLYETDPNTSSAWTASGVNALEAGATVR